MASTYVNNLRLNEMATGDQSGTWGTTTNTNLELIGQALGWGTRAIANASTDNITIADGASDADRSMALKLTGGGQACTVTILPNTSSKVWVMENATAATLTFTQGSGANVAILAGETKMIATDGLGSGAVVYDVLTDLNLAGTTKVAGLSVAGLTSIATNQKVQFRDNAIYLNSSADGQLDIVADTEIQIAATTVDINGAVDLSADLTVGDDLTVNGGVIELRTDSGSVGQLKLYCETSNNHAQTLSPQAHSVAATNTLTLPGGSTIGNSNATLVSDTGTQTLTNKSLTSPTITGTAVMATLDISGDVDVDGTLEADAITLAGTALGSIFSPIAGGGSIVTTGALNSGSITSGFGTINNGSSAITTTGVGTFASLDISGDVDVDGTLEADAITLNGTALASIFSPIAGGGSIVTTGALNSGSITSGFGTIDTGSSTITTTGTVATGAITAGNNITRGGTVITDGSITDTGNFTLDIAGDLTLDAAGSDFNFDVAGTNIFKLTNSSQNLLIQTAVSDKDIQFKGNDGGAVITALTLDMSAAGAATFNNDVTAFSDERLKSNITTIPDALSKVSEMRGVHYVRNETGKDSSGVIAQEMQKVAPELVLTAEDEMGTLSVNYGNITGYLIEAIKELKAEIEVLKGK